MRRNKRRGAFERRTVGRDETQQGDGKGDKGCRGNQTKR